MLGKISPYYEPIMAACLTFPLVAALFTVPFMVLNYRKYGGIALMRVLVVYSFILYSMCAFLLTVLPLPSREAVAAMGPKEIGWVPFTDLRVGLENAGMNFSDGTTFLFFDRWKRFFTSGDFFQIVANVIMQIPLGFYLRYYFRCSVKKTVLIGFCVSLFYELTQLSGLYFIYPHAYRFASVDDLITNTLGAWLGYGLTPLIALILPSRDEIDRISYQKGEHLTLLRRALAAMLDLAVLSSLQFGHIWTGTHKLSVRAFGLLGFILYFGVLAYAMGGRTPGQMLLKIRVVQERTLARPTFIQLIARNMLLYVAEPFLVLMATIALGGLVITFMAEGLEMAVIIFLVGGCTAVLLIVMWIFLRCQRKWNTFPHGHYSHTVVVKEIKK